MKHTNTQYFDQLDWNKEIKDHKHGEKYILAQFTKAVGVWVMFKDHTLNEKSLAEMTEPHMKSNIMRMAQYFYAKFMYYHAEFYKLNVDYVEAAAVYKSVNGDVHPIEFLQKILGKLERSNVPLEMILPIEDIMDKAYRQSLPEPVEHGGYKELKQLFKERGLDVIKAKGVRDYHDRDTGCIEHEGVNYHLYLMRDDRSSEAVDQEIANHKEILEKYHELVKLVYREIGSIVGHKNLWAMEGGGAQSQVFFGNQTGYLAILYLGMKGEKQRKQIYNLIINGCKNDDLLKNMKIKGVKVITSESIYGKD